MMLIHATSVRSTHEGATPDEAALLRSSRNFCLSHAQNALLVIDSTFRSEYYLRSWYIHIRAFQVSFPRSLTQLHRYYTAAYTTISAASVILGVLFNHRFAVSCNQEDQNDAIDDVELACEILESMEDCPIALMAEGAIAGALTRYREWTATEEGTPRSRHEHEVGEFRSELQGDMAAGEDPDRDYWLQWITEIEKLGTVY